MTCTAHAEAQVPGCIAPWGLGAGHHASLHSHLTQQQNQHAQQQVLQQQQQEQLLPLCSQRLSCVLPQAVQAAINHAHIGAL